MAEKKIIAVVGSTGAQGGGLARAILADPDSDFAVRAITRNPSSEPARALAQQGAEVVRADLDQPDTVRQAFEGAYGAFCVTNFWEYLSAEREIAQARTMAEAAGAAGLAHTIWSTFEDTRRWIPLDDERMPTLQGRFNVPHYDGKGEADSLFSGVPATLLRTSLYWENFIYLGMGPQPGPDGKLVLMLPLGDAPLPGIASEDIGRAAYGIFRQRLVDRTIGVAGGMPTGVEMAAAFTEALGQPVSYQPVEPDAYRSFDFPGADEMGNMFQFIRDFSDAHCGARDVELTRSLNPQLQAFDQWLSANAGRIPLSEDASPQG
jgi:uncharacterized protein YbjT (DUF2867 family)